METGSMCDAATLACAGELWLHTFSSAGLPGPRPICTPIAPRKAPFINWEFVEGPYRTWLCTPFYECDGQKSGPRTYYGSAKPTYPAVAPRSPAAVCADAATVV
jgi:hypothetical protein